MNIIEHNYAMKIDNLIESINYITDNAHFFQSKNILTGYLIDAVHAIADCYERNKAKISSDDKGIVLAFCYLNNQLKHDKELEIFTIQIFSAVFPTRFPLRLGSSSHSFIWENFEDHGSVRAEAKREHYDEFLNGKDVKDTIMRVKTILDNICNN